MIKKQTIGMILTALLLLTGISGAKENTMPPGKWWNNSSVIKKIDLSEDEISQLDSAFNESYREMIELRSTSAKERFELEVLMEDATLDEDAVMAQFKKTDHARSAISEQRFLLLLEVRKIIGYERFKTLKTTFQNSRNKKNKKTYVDGKKKSENQ